jgi:sirohydrochlorin ferrochelatase
MHQQDPSTTASTPSLRSENTPALRTERMAIIIVDHGSRRTESNRMLEEVARLFAERFTAKYGIVEPAHMELSEPSIATAYTTCVKRGATRIVVCPFFLGPGKHWTSDIPRLTAEAAMDHPATQYHVAQTLGIDDLILDLLDKRASHCTEHNFLCDICKGSLRSGEASVIATQEAELKADKAAGPHLCGTCPFKGQALPQKH